MHNNKILITIQYDKESIEEVAEAIDNLLEKNIESEKIIILTYQKNENLRELCLSKSINYEYHKDLNNYLLHLEKHYDFDYKMFINVGDRIPRIIINRVINPRSYNNNVYILPLKTNKASYSLISKQKNGFVDIDGSKNLWIYLNSALISKKVISKYNKQNIKNNNTLRNNYQNLLFLQKVITINGGYNYVKGKCMITQTILEDSLERLPIEYDLSWYLDFSKTFEDLFQFSINNYGVVTKNIQKVFIYYLKIIFKKNTNTNNKQVLINNDLNTFYKELKENLKMIDDNMIINSGENQLINLYLLRLKYDNESNIYKYRILENSIKLTENNVPILNVANNKIKILLMESEKNLLNIVGQLTFPISDDKFKIAVMYGEEKITAEKIGLYSDYKIFGKTVYNSYSFKVSIPLNETGKYIKFFIEYEDVKIPLDIRFVKPQSKLNNLKDAYWVCGDFTLNYRKKGIYVLRNSKLRHIKRELKYLKYLYKAKKKEVFTLRVLYYISKLFIKKEIWLFEDKIYKAGDNGEYLYTYARTLKDNINKYYILRKDCIDAKRFKEQKKPFVEYGSLKHKLLFLNSSIVFITHNNTPIQHSFDVKNELYFRDLFNSQNVHIQHGLSVQYIPHLTNRINDNIKRFFLTSPIEKENLSGEEYSYDDLSILKITGLPRFDGLINNDKRQILITPTWRNYLATPESKHGGPRKSNNIFKNSEYYKIYNNLINDNKLIECAAKNGYKIIYLLHPCTSPQINDFDKNDYVELIAATDDLNYEKILTESSLMVTDYSGVQFDFAYMYKPIIYYHPSKLPPSYDEGTYNYSTMSLGEIVKEHDEIIEKLCEYMNNNCQVKEEYKKRIDRFFKYHDNDNCERIIKEIKEFRRKDNE